MSGLFDKRTRVRAPCQLPPHADSKELEVVDTFHLITVSVEGELVLSCPEVSDQLLCPGGVRLGYKPTRKTVHPEPVCCLSVCSQAHHSGVISKC